MVSFDVSPAGPALTPMPVSTSARRPSTLPVASTNVAQNAGQRADALAAPRRAPQGTPMRSGRLRRLWMRSTPTAVSRPSSRTDVLPLAAAKVLGLVARIGVLTKRRARPARAQASARSSAISGRRRRATADRGAPDRPELHTSDTGHRGFRGRPERRVGARLSRALRVVGCIAVPGYGPSGQPDGLYVYASSRSGDVRFCRDDGCSGSPMKGYPVAAPTLRPPARRRIVPRRWPPHRRVTGPVGV
jgi:hypothetical protein